MLTEKGCLARRRRLLERVQGCDLLVISLPQHIFYLSNFLTRPTELAGWGPPSFLLIDREGQARLVANNWAEAAAGDAFVDERDVWPWYDFSGPAAEKYSAAAAALAAVLAQHYRRPGRVAVDYAYLPTAAREVLGASELLDVEPVFREMRRSKYEDELACIRRAIVATEAGHRAARDKLRAGMTEMEIYAEVQAAITAAAGEPILMLGDFAAGERSGTGGGPPTGNVLREGDLMIFDLFPVIAGYRADITNTLCAGEPTQAQQDHLAALQAAMQAAEAMLRPGVTGAEVYAACRAPLEAAGLADAFDHHAGHGLGLGHPEPPFLVPGSQEALQAGDVVTLEPGAYIKGWGGARIEHNYLITAGGYERLSNHQIGL